MLRETLYVDREMKSEHLTAVLPFVSGQVQKCKNECETSRRPRNEVFDLNSPTFGPVKFCVCYSLQATLAERSINSNFI